MPAALYGLIWRTEFYMSGRLPTYKNSESLQLVHNLAGIRTYLGRLGWTNIWSASWHHSWSWCTLWFSKWATALFYSVQWITVIIYFRIIIWWPMHSLATCCYLHSCIFGWLTYQCMYLARFWWSLHNGYFPPGKFSWGDVHNHIPQPQVPRNHFIPVSLGRSVESYISDKSAGFFFYMQWSPFDRVFDGQVGFKVFETAGWFLLPPVMQGCFTAGEHSACWNRAGQGKT